MSDRRRTGHPVLTVGHSTRTIEESAELLEAHAAGRLISDALMVRNIPVEHILVQTSQQPHTLTPWAEVAGEDGQLVYPPQSPAPSRSSGVASRLLR